MYLFAIVALLFASIIYGLIIVRRKRAEMIGLPSPPVKFWLIGNIDVVAKAAIIFPPDTHFQHVVNYIQEKYDMPSVWYLDLWPVSTRWIFCNDPVYASRYATTGQSLPKSLLSNAYLDQFLGPKNLVTAEGGHWKSLRGIFNPGFSAAHLMTLVPYIVDCSLTFLDVMTDKARSNELFQLEEYATRLTIDIIGKVALDADFDSQKRDHPLVTTFRERTPLMPNGSRTLPFLNDLEFIRLWKLRQNGKKLDALVGKEIDRTIGKRTQNSNRLEAGAKPASFRDRKRSIVDLALDAYYSEKMVSAAGNVKPSREMDAAFRAEAITSVKTFIFAGHDTTSSTIAYTLYLVHHHPTVHARLLAELHSTFGASLDPAVVAQSLKSEPHLINSLTYTTAVIKEVLRLFPPASTLRGSPCLLPNNNGNQPLHIPNPTPGANPANSPPQFPLWRDMTFWPIALLIHRNPLYFPDPQAFVPERFIPELTPYPDAKLFADDGSGKDAFRAFEKGNRGCIGEQLALIETKVILALVVGAGLDFVAELCGTEAACAVAERDWKEEAEPDTQPDAAKGDVVKKGGWDRQEKIQTGSRINHRDENHRRRAPVNTLVDAEEWAERMKKGGGVKATTTKAATAGDGGFGAGEIGTVEEKKQMKEWCGRTVEGYGIYQMLKGAAKPAYGMPGRIYLRGSLDQKKAVDVAAAVGDARENKSRI